MKATTATKDNKRNRAEDSAAEEGAVQKKQKLQEVDA